MVIRDWDWKKVASVIVFCQQLIVGHVMEVHELTLKMPRKPASENVICLCRLQNILANLKPILSYKQTMWTLIRGAV